MPCREKCVFNSRFNCDCCHEYNFGLIIYVKEKNKDIAILKTLVLAIIVF